MENDHILYYVGTSTRPSVVRVLVFHDQLHLRKDEDPSFDKAFSFSAAHLNTIGSTQYLYLDKAGLAYLEYPLDHPLACIFMQEIEKNKGNWAQKLLKQRTAVLLSIV